ncbi:MAG: hypothetical protein WEA76_11625, partial [Acidimicrobiia bacterium]
MGLEWVSDRLAHIYAHPRWIILNGVSANTQVLIDQLREWGASEFLVVAGEEGVGAQPEGETVFMPSPPGTVMEGFRRFASKVDEPPPHVRDAVDAFDPDDTARVLGPVFGAPASFLGRHLYGTRPGAWEAFEDKTVADEIWDEAAIPRAPSELVALADAPLAAGRLAGALGTVWAADNTNGWHGGGEMTRWVTDDDTAKQVVAEFTDRTRTVRVMPFLEGVPCSVHGVVTGDGVAALRPVELLILHRLDRNGFVYGGVANTWDPPAAIRDEMRQASRSVGEVLRRRMDYRGPFSIDGVATADGFRPTELNPRFSVGYGIQANAVSELHGMFFVRAIVEGDLDPVADDLEQLIVTAADANRGVRVAFPVEGVHERRSIRLVPRGAGVVEDPDGDLLELGPSPYGAFLFWSVDPSRFEKGARVAPHAAAIADFARASWNASIPPCEPAPDV